MTNKEAFTLAHKFAKEDRAFDSSKSYAYYFRLQLLNCQAIQREKRTGMVPAFTIQEGRMWV